MNTSTKEKNQMKPQNKMNSDKDKEIKSQNVKKDSDELSLSKSNKESKPIEKGKRKKKTIYYSDELNDDFLKVTIKPKPIPENFKYVHKNPIWRCFSFLLYYCIAAPIVYFYTYIVRGVRFKNKKSFNKLRKTHKGGIFLYGNHTGAIDAYTPNIISVPRKNRIVVSPQTLSIRGIKNIVQMLGAIPVPSDFVGMKNFKKALEYYNEKGSTITIYPEAHIWPYYTGVRPFKDSSFAYPVSMDSPVVAFFTAYSKPTGMFKKIRKADVTVYVSEPFYPDKTKHKKEAQKELRDKVYDFMEECSKKYSTYSYIEYKHIEEKQEGINEDVLDYKDCE